MVPEGRPGKVPSQFEPVLNKVRVPRLGSGRPRTRPDRVRGDNTYASRVPVLAVWLGRRSATAAMERPSRYAVRTVSVFAAGTARAGRALGLGGPEPVVGLL